MKLLEMTTHDFARLEPSLAFLPLGTVEAHDLGPLGTDAVAPERIACDLAGRFGAVVLPTMPYGLVRSLAGHPGGMWLTEDTYRAVVLELIGSISLSGVSRLVVFNGHGGNTGVLREVLPEAVERYGTMTALVDWWVTGGDIARRLFGGAAGHGGSDELSVVFSDRLDMLPEWDGSRSWRAVEGAWAWPAPRSSIRYDDEPARPLERGAAAEYYRLLLERLEVTVEGILSGWDSIPRIT